MNNNGSYYAIKGFLYQFDKVLIEISRNPRKKVGIEKSNVTGTVLCHILGVLNNYGNI